MLPTVPLASVSANSDPGAFLAGMTPTSPRAYAVLILTLLFSALVYLSLCSIPLFTLQKAITFLIKTFLNLLLLRFTFISMDLLSF